MKRHSLTELKEEYATIWLALEVLDERIKRLETIHRAELKQRYGRGKEWNNNSD